MANDTPGPDVPSDGDEPRAGHPTSPCARPDQARPDQDGEQTARHGVDESTTAEPDGSTDATPPHGTQAYPATGQHAANRYGPTPYGAGQYRYGAAPHGGGAPYGQYPAAGQYAPGPYGGAPGARPTGPRVGRGMLVAIALLTGLLGGVIGGAVVTSLAGGSGGSSGVLGAPLPEVEDASAPVGPVEAVAARVLPSVVRLQVTGGGQAGEGSGMVLTPDGLMLTNNHVVAPAANGGSIVAVFQDGTTAPADIVGLDPSSDLAVIRAQGVSGLTPIEFGNSDAVRVGQQVVAVGSPLGLGGTVTTGIISAVDRAVSVGAGSGASEATVLSALQTDAAINPGNSGGPLTDMEGRVVGINSVIATTGAEGGSIGVGFSIPVNHAQRVAGELERTGRAERAQLGVLLNQSADGSGAAIESVVPGGPAEAAGIRAGDVVSRYGDQLISDQLDLLAAVGSSAPGEVVEVRLGNRSVQLTLGVLPR